MMYLIFEIRLLNTHCYMSALNESNLDLIKNYDQNQLNRALSKSCESGDLEIAKYLITCGADVNYCDGIPLISACENGYLELTKYLINSGANIDNSALMWACFHGHFEIVKYLVSCGANIHSQEDYPLIASASNGHLDLFEYLIDKFKSPEILDKALNAALMYGHSNIVNYLLKSGLSISDEQKDRYLISAAQNNRLQFIEYLISIGADINSSSALFAACQAGHLEIVEYLVRNRAKQNLNSDEILNQALKFAVRYYKIKVVKYLVGNGATISDDLLSLGVGNLELMKYLIDNGANNCDDALIASAENRNFDSMKFLLENGANVHANNEQVLHICIQNGNLDVVKYLVEKGANIHANNQLLTCAVHYGCQKIVEYLLKNGVKIDSDDEIVKSCIRNLEMMKYLIDNGANIRAKNDEALVYSIRSHNLESAKYLIDRGCKNNRALEACLMHHDFQTLRYLIDNGADIHFNNDEILQFSVDCEHWNFVKYLISKGANGDVNEYVFKKLTEKEII